MKTLVSDINISKTPQGGTVINAAGRYFTVSPETALLVELMSSRLNLSVADLATRLSASLGYTVSSDEVMAATEQLPKAFFEVEPDRKKFNFSISILKGNALELLARFFSVFFNPIVAAISILFTLFMLARVIQSTALVHGVSIFIPLLVLLSILFHEVGHAAACFAMGAKPGLIGFGLRGVFPTFYTDVSDIWTGGRKQRMIVDAAGVYFQLIFVATIALFIPYSPLILPSAKIIIFLAAFSCLPYFKFDGYWFLGDFLGKDSLAGWIKNSASGLFLKLKTGQLVGTDIYAFLGLAAYLGGFVFLQLWLLSTLLKLMGTDFFGLLNNASQAIKNPSNINEIADWYSRLDSVQSIIIVLLVFPFAAGLYRTFKWLTGRSIRKILNDVVVILSAIFAAAVIHILCPLYKFFPSIRKNVDEINSALNEISPSVSRTRRVAIKNVISRYQKIIWYLVLSKVDVQTGLWLIKKTHRVQSKHNFSYVNEMPGPVILVAPHFGSFISGAMVLLAEIGTIRPIHLFYADPKTDPDNARYENFYRRYFPNLSVCLNNKRGMVQAIHALRRGEVLVIMPDAFSGKDDLVKIQFMGRNIGVMQGIAYFNRKFNAKVVPILSRFRGAMAVDIHIEKELTFGAPEIDHEADHKRIMFELFSYLEKWFMAFPHEWHCWDKFINQSLPK